MIHDGSLAIFEFSGPSIARPCVLFPMPRYLQGRWHIGTFSICSIFSGQQWSKPPPFWVSLPTASPGSQGTHTTHLWLTEVSLSWLTAKSCSRYACFISSERPYRKWSIPKSETTGLAGEIGGLHRGLCAQSIVGTLMSFYGMLFNQKGYVGKRSNLTSTSTKWYQSQYRLPFQSKDAESV